MGFGPLARADRGTEDVRISTLDGEPFFALSGSWRKQYRCTGPSGRQAELPTELCGLWVTLVVLALDALIDDTTRAAHARLQRRAAALVTSSDTDHASVFAQLCDDAASCTTNNSADLENLWVGEAVPRF